MPPRLRSGAPHGGTSDRTSGVEKRNRRGDVGYGELHGGNIGPPRPPPPHSLLGVPRHRPRDPPNGACAPGARRRFRRRSGAPEGRRAEPHKRAVTARAKARSTRFGPGVRSALGHAARTAGGTETFAPARSQQMQAKQTLAHVRSRQLTAGADPEARNNPRAPSPRRACSFMTVRNPRTGLQPAGLAHPCGVLGERRRTRCIASGSAFGQMSHSGGLGGCG